MGIMMKSVKPVKGLKLFKKRMVDAHESWWPKWGKMAMIEVRKSLQQDLPTLVLMLMLDPSFR